MSEVIVVKMGGAASGGRDTTVADLVQLQREGRRVVVVHGGGSLITGWLAKQGISTRFVRGERVTDVAALEVVTAVLCGLANKEIVAAINSSGGRAVGISGVDGSLIKGKVNDKALGYVGAVAQVDTALLEALLGAGYLPVVSPVGLNMLAEGGAPQLLNINGDPVAGEIAAAIDAERLVFLTDVDGIHDQSGKALARLSAAEAGELLSSGVASGGMIPKVKACLRALERAQAAHIIDGRKPHALLRNLRGEGGGTTIYGAVRK